MILNRSRKKYFILGPKIPIPPYCYFTPGEGTGGTYEEVGQTDTREECVKLVDKTEPTASGVTYRIGGTSCYALFGFTRISPSHHGMSVGGNIWETCRIGNSFLFLPVVLCCQQNIYYVI